MSLAIAGGEPVRSEPLPSWENAGGRRIGEAEQQAVQRVLESGTLWRVGGTETPALEREFARLIGAGNAVASTSGTAALHLAVAAVAPEPGDEIIVPPITDFGTVIAALACNAVPVFADVDPLTGCMTAEAVRAAITDRTRAVIVVHLFGGAAPVDDIVAICRPLGIAVIEDCAQAYRTVATGGEVGTRGTIGCFSLQQSKHITAGDGGLTVTDDDRLAERMRLFADKGWPRSTGERTHLSFGMNYRMTELTAAVARAQLGKLDQVVADRRAVAAALVDGLADLDGLRLVPADRVDRHSFWLFPLWFDRAACGFDTASFAAALTAEGVPVSAGYLNRPVHLNPALTERRIHGSNGFPLTSPPASRQISYRVGDCPVAEAMIAGTLVTAPCNENFDDRDVADVIAAVRKVHAGLRAAAA